MEEYLECAQATRWSKQHHLSKAKIRAIIAGFYEDDPFKGFHHLFEKKVFSVCHECFDGLADILNRFDEIVETSKF